MGFDAYEQFLVTKSPADAPSGLAIVPELSRALKPFQAAITGWALRRGRAAIFAGCVAGETIVNTPDGDFRIDAIARKGVPISVYALLGDGTLISTIASAPFKKGTAHLYEFKLASGKSIIVTGHHRFLTPDGWKYASLVAVGERLLVCAEDHLASISESSRQASQQDDRGSSQKLQGYQDHCFGDCRPYDELLPLVEGIAQASLPSQGDVFLHDSPQWKMDDQEHRQGHTHHRQYTRHLSMPDSVSLRNCVEGASGFHTPPYDQELTESYTQTLVRSLMNSCLQPPCGEPHPLADELSLAVQSLACGSSVLDTVVSADYIRTGDYYDMYVPIYENYLANGIWHHNTGLGKTLMQLEWARVVSEEVGNVLILCPLAVAEQTVAEAAKFGIEGVAYATDQGSATTDIVITNYERFEKFDIARYAGIVLDESGIIKSSDGKTRKLLTDACRDVAWKLCCTATPSPNDYTELGQHSEFLGVMDAKEMLAMFFVHDGSIRAGDATQGNDGWRMKRHAAADFWRWLASWSVMVRHPRDLGFDEPGYDLPPLNLHQVTVAAEYKPTAGELFPMQASTLAQRIGVRRDTAKDRVAKAAEIILRESKEPWIIWTHLNSEADMIEKLLPDALQVAGKHKPEIKIERLLGFTRGNPLQLVSKGSIAGRGMNYQHCARQIMVGLTDSFEEVYQCIRRSWRFGQTRPVDVYFIASELEGNVVANLKRKEQAFELMLDAMSEHMRDLQRENVLGGRNATFIQHPHMKMEIPTWLTSA